MRNRCVAGVFIFLMLFSVSVVLAEEDEANSEIVCTAEYAPVCGSVQVVCVTAPCDPLYETFGNKCELEKSGATFVYEGECSNETIPEKDIFEDYEDEEFDTKPGIKPDSIFYGIDKFFDRFGDELEVREERIAEIKYMIEKGDMKSARKALKEYKKIVKKLEKEVDPEKREEALKSAAGIRNVMGELLEKIPEEEKEEFFEEVIEHENTLATSAEIASKINDLCRELSDLDPELFYKTCNVGDDSPKWHKDLYKDLTDEQKKEAKKFAGIMSQCFKTSGQDCRCEDIPFKDFAEACSKAAPLAVACDIEGNEDACDDLDNLEMPELPEHLQDVFDDLEGMQEDRYEMHMPKECKKEGIQDPKECGRLMIKLHAPEECREALIEADVKTEREGREICDKVMMQKHAPECVEEGITDPDECQDYMFNINRRPKECIDNQIHDVRDCKAFLDRTGKYAGRKDAKGYGGDCRSIENPEERLKCYDGAVKNAGDYGEEWKKIKEKERQCADDCSEKGGRWDFSNGDCKCYTDDDYPEKKGRGNYWEGCEALDCGRDSYCEYGECKPFEKGGDYEESECKDGCQNECPGASRTSCNSDEKCECYYEDKDDDRDDFIDDRNEDCGDFPCDYDPNEGNDYPSDDNSGDEGSGDETPSEESQEEEPEPEDEGSNDEEPSDSTGAGITGNFFLDYYFD